jgi:hypothetical protein
MKNTVKQAGTFDDVRKLVARTPANGNGAAS